MNEETLTPGKIFDIISRRAPKGVYIDIARSRPGSLNGDRKFFFRWEYFPNRSTLPSASGQIVFGADEVEIVTPRYVEATADKEFSGCSAILRQAPTDFEEARLVRQAEKPSSETTALDALKLAEQWICRNGEPHGLMVIAEDQEGGPYLASANMTRERAVYMMMRQISGLILAPEGGGE